MSQKVFEQSGRASEIIESLRDISRRDDIIEGRRRRWGCATAIAWAATFVSFVTSVFVIGPDSSSFLILPLVVVVVAIAATVVYAINVKRDVEDRKIETCLRFFEVISKDIPKKAKCQVTVSFAPCDKHGELLSKEGGRFSGVVNERYADTWLTAKGKLHDGNTFSLSVVQTVKRKMKRKRKYTKVKERITEKVALALRLDGEAYPKTDQLSEHLSEGAEAGGLTITKVGLQDSALSITAVTGLCTSQRGRSTVQRGRDNLVDGDKLLQLFMFVYAGLAKCR